MHVRKHLLLLVLCLIGFFLSSSAMAAKIFWTPTDSWVPDATSGSIAYKSGTIDVTVSGSGTFTTGGSVIPGFATTSANYENIDTATHHRFRTIYDAPGTNWSVEFDLVGTSITSADVFTIGQLFVSSTGGPLTSMTVEIFGLDDTTAIDLTTVDFEQHALATPGFDALLDWNPATGDLVPLGEANSKNSGWGFFSPTNDEIGKIVLTGSSVIAPDEINYGFGAPIPLPAAAWLFGSALAGLLTMAKRKYSI